MFKTILKPKISIFIKQILRGLYRLKDGTVPPLRTESYWNYCKAHRTDKNFWLTIFDVAGVTEITILPPENSSLQLFNDQGQNVPLIVTMDNGVGLKYLVTGAYDPATVNFFGYVLRENPSEKFTAIDVGSNLGLFSRHLLNNFGDQITLLYAYEPDKNIARICDYNLAGWSDDVKVHAVGLGENAGEATFYFDEKHPSSSSLDKEALPDEFYSVDQTEVDILSAASESEKWLSFGDGRRILYKSDTQGFDEKIFLNLDNKVYDKIAAGLLEIFPRDRKEEDVVNLLSVLKRYDRLFILRHGNTKALISLDELRNELLSSSGFDIGFYN